MANLLDSVLTEVCQDARDVAGAVQQQIDDLPSGFEERHLEDVKACSGAPKASRSLEFEFSPIFLPGPPNS